MAKAFKILLRMKYVAAPVCQIHHTGSDRWVTSVLSENCNEIIIFNSLQGKFPSISNSLKLQLFAVYGGTKKHLNIKIPQVQQQSNLVDCGLFAIALAAEFCFNGYDGDDSIEFDRQFMRAHVLACFQRKTFSHFPKSGGKCDLNL